MQGTELVFEFWGTKDGRQVTTTTPVVYNIVAPPKPEYIESDELKPGEKRLIEHAHSGADAYFKRTVTWPEGVEHEVIEEIWRSHYVPWREKWLVGVNPDKATTTDVVIEE